MIVIVIIFFWCNIGCFCVLFNRKLSTCAKTY